MISSLHSFRSTKKKPDTKQSPRDKSLSPRDKTSPRSANATTTATITTKKQQQQPPMEPLNESSGDDLFGDMDLEFSDAIQQKQQQEETTPSAPPLSNVSQLEDLDLTPQSCDGFAG